MTTKKMNLRDVFDLIQMCIQLKPQVTNRDMRGMVTHLFQRTLNSSTHFTGMVSESAIVAIEKMEGTYLGHTVVREHHHKIQTQITQLIGQMRESGDWNFDVFEASIMEWSSINITTAEENSRLRRIGTTYESLGIALVHWDKLSSPVRKLIRKYLLRHDIANRHDWNVDKLPSSKK
jgi:hypothetical protein